jgi:hypothetical protein
MQAWPKGGNRRAHGRYVLLQRRTKCFAKLLHVCTAFSSPFGKASPSTWPRLAGVKCGSEDGLQISSFCGTGADETNRQTPSLSPTETFCPLQSGKTMAKFDYAAKVLHLRKERCIRLLTGGLCLPQLPLSITTLLLKRTTIWCLEHNVALW